MLVPFIIQLAHLMGFHVLPLSQWLWSSCTFDGGGTIADGAVAATDTGRWFCADGTLVHMVGTSIQPQNLVP